jgi:flagellar L-ring protein FlgH
MSRIGTITRTSALLAILVASAMSTASNAAAQRQSWTSDRRDYAVGDVLTVMIDEYTMAAANQGTFASDRRFRDLGVDAAQNVVAGGPRVGARVSSTNQAESRQRGEATRQNRFQGEMTVRILAVEEGGMLRVEGRKVVKIDRISEELVMRGVIRPQDVSSANMVDSWRVGDAELVYSSSGGRPRGGIVGRLLGAIWP